ncbi:Protein phosphatase 1 regulatory subunit 1C [Oryzias melastigma]|uniref:Protein phosphatase 1 regulatory subunit 1C n=1 Tax=Oryzias melastigma TaxID=30732 RepID=A0A834FNV8_ORYME|nr:Protein phosphatase 1 regulatory subunit 1C [Oryzias melastigma]
MLVSQLVLRDNSYQELEGGHSLHTLSMDSSICGSVIMEPSSPKKIQFAAPPLQGQLDPQAAEQIRRRRPTPATLQIYRQPGSDAADQHNASGDSQASHAFQKKQSTYDSPTVKGKLEGAVLEEEEEA